VTELVVNRLRSVSEVAGYLRQSEQLGYRHIRSKKLQATNAGGEWRVSNEAIRKLLEDEMNVKQVLVRLKHQ
jgi:excisionase family DNA binding protein